MLTNPHIHYGHVKTNNSFAALMFTETMKWLTSSDILSHYRCLRQIRLIVSREIIGLHVLILYVFEYDTSVLLCIYSIDMEMFVLHELILYDFLDLFSVLLCIHIGYIEMLGLHELILNVFEDIYCVLIWSHIGCTDIFHRHELIWYVFGGHFLQ